MPVRRERSLTLQLPAPATAQDITAGFARVVEALAHGELTPSQTGRCTAAVGGIWFVRCSLKKSPRRPGPQRHSARDARPASRMEVPRRLNRPVFEPQLAWAGRRDASGTTARLGFRYNVV